MAHRSTHLTRPYPDPLPPPPKTASEGPTVDQLLREWREVRALGGDEVGARYLQQRLGQRMAPAEAQAQVKPAEPPLTPAAKVAIVAMLSLALWLVLLSVATLLF